MTPLLSYLDRQLRFRIFNPIRKKTDGKSDNARMRIARHPLRKRLRLLQKIKEVHVVAETFNIVASRRFQALCKLISITEIPHEQQPRRVPVPVVNAYLHTAPLRYPKIELPLDSDGSAAFKVLKKLQVAGHMISASKGLDYYYIGTSLLWLHPSYFKLFILPVKIEVSC